MRRALYACGLFFVTACVDPGATRTPAVPAQSTVASAVRVPLPPMEVAPSPPPSAPPSFEPTLRDAPLLVGLKSAVILTGTKSVGSTSVVLKVPLDGGIDAAFKPESRKHGARWRAEIAAYRLSRALGLDHVPPSVPRAAKLSALRASSTSAKTKQLLDKQIVPSDDDRISGAMIAWLPGLKRLALEFDPLWTAWGEWLALTPPKRSIEERVPKSAAKRIRDARPLAPQVSSLVLFDHVTGNRDRWSGHNVLTDVTGTRLVFLDNNLAFEPTLDSKSTKKRTHVLHRVQRFSRSLVAALRALDRPSLIAALGVDDRGAPLLEDPQVDAILERRDEALAWVDALIATHGAEKVLCFE